MALTRPCNAQRDRSLLRGRSIAKSLGKGQGRLGWGGPTAAHRSGAPPLERASTTTPPRRAKGRIVRSMHAARIAVTSVATVLARPLFRLVFVASSFIAGLA